MTLDDILKQLTDVGDQKDAIINEAVNATKHMKWVPNPGPQTDAYFTEADEVFYGGQAGGGKSDLLLGLALNEHTKSLILRKTYKEAKGLVERLVEIVGTEAGLNRSLGEFRIGNQLIETGGCENPGDEQKYKGRPHDLKGFDEISDFAEHQYKFICGWNRSAKPGQRCRIFATGNPPTTPEGLWVLKHWGAWLDPDHPNPAQPGELRWYTTGDNGEEIEVDGPGPHMLRGEPIYARSRTFIPAKLSDNPDLAASGYDATLAALPEELRSAYRDGVFTTAMKDDAYQVIPTAWVQMAFARWTPNPPPGVPQTAIGADVAQNGDDKTVLAPRHGSWYDKLTVIDGKDTPDGESVAGRVVAMRRDMCPVVVDVGGGWGAAAAIKLAENGVEVHDYMGVKAYKGSSKCGKFKFTNIRTAAYWAMREALDPAQPGGSQIALNRDSVLLADLCAPRYKTTPRGIVITSKEDVVKQIGRSPDRGDAVVMAWWKGVKQENIKGGWTGRGTKRSTTANMSPRSSRRRH